MFAETEVLYAGKTINLVFKVGDVARDLIDKGLLHVILLPSGRTGEELHVKAVPQRYGIISIYHHCNSSFFRSQQIPVFVFGYRRRTRAFVRTASVQSASVYTIFFCESTVR